jgi:hypothetical protein
MAKILTPEFMQQLADRKERLEFVAATPSLARLVSSRRSADGGAAVGVRADPTLFRGPSGHLIDGNVLAAWADRLKLGSGARVVAAPGTGLWVPSAELWQALVHLFGGRDGLPLVPADDALRLLLRSA